jgi:hypothetical protein
LPRISVAKGKARQQWLFRPDRTRAIDTDFLNFLDESWRELASDLLRQNIRADLLEGTRLNEAAQRILDRLLFLRICEDRDIDTGRSLASILKFWRDNAEAPTPRRMRRSLLLVRDNEEEDKAIVPRPPISLWREIVAHFRALDHRPRTSTPLFNGNLFKPHFLEELTVSDEWLAHFLDDIGDEESPYLVLLPIIMVGQNVIQSQNEAKADADHHTLTYLATLQDEQMLELKNQTAILQTLEALLRKS